MVSRTGIHVLRALVFLAGRPPGTYSGVAVLAEAVGAPPNYLGKLLQGLTRQDVVRSRKGAGGGFALGQPAERISLAAALEPIENFDRWQGCLLGRPHCSDRDACPVHAAWAPVRDQYLEFLRTTSLAQLAENPGRLPSGRSRARGSNAGKRRPDSGKR